MAVSYSKDRSLISAIVMTFDGQHPCKMCGMIRDGRQHEEKQQEQLPGSWGKGLLDLILEGQGSLLAVHASLLSDAVPSAPERYSDFIDSPATPPPRSHGAAL